MARYLFILLIVGAGVFETKACSQSLFSSRAIGIGAYGPFVSDTRSFTDNPAGIVSMKDWDMTVSTYVGSVSSNNGFVFQGLSLGKRFLDRYAFALQYSPGTSMEFVIPTALTLVSTSPTSIDQRVSYDEPFAAAIAYKISSTLSVGVSSRYRKERITDTQYQLVLQDTISYIERLPDVEESASTWNIDVGVHWKPADDVTLSAVGRNLLQSKRGSFPQASESYRIANDRSLQMGIGYNLGSSLTLAGQYSTSNDGALGYEWKAGSGFSARSGVYLNKFESPFVYAIGLGLGWSYKFVEADMSYLGFLSSKDREGSSSVQGFDPSLINSIDLNRYTSNRVQFSLKVIFGTVRASLITIGGVEILEGVYPSGYEAFASRPIGKVHVKNISGKPVEARARFYVDKYMDSPTESQPVYMLPGEEKELPLTAMFNEKVKGVEQMMVREGNVYVSATPAEEYDDRYAARVVFHGKHDWDGSVSSLRYFVTPEDPSILRYTRDVLLQHKDSLGNISAGLEDFQKARVLFNAFAKKLVYVSDPKQSADYVQYPSETLQLQGGDCDDLTTCFSSLLNSVGISTAFIDVVPPEDSSKSHVYLLFDTGLDPRYGNSISSNTKRYMIRKNQKGVETIWIPVETTVITRGFETAWSQGAQEYFDDVEIGLGLIKGWVKIVDVY